MRRTHLRKKSWVSVIQAMSEYESDMGNDSDSKDEVKEGEIDGSKISEDDNDGSSSGDNFQPPKNEKARVEQHANFTWNPRTAWGPSHSDSEVDLTIIRCFDFLAVQLVSCEGSRKVKELDHCP
ncbi:hypothetical protein JB92DRAFT_2834210 [Gautieria morchelliformis]|nr:hypothetical protein JB92DRAFT_2834210 [Gautieria morchelliformis]